MKRALVLTVGTGTRPDVNITKPLRKTIEDSHPDFILFVVTSESEKFAREIAERMELSPKSCDYLKLDDFDDFQRVFKQINCKFRDIKRMGFDAKNIQVDFTSGTKAMTGGLVLSAIYNSCQSLKYITGTRKNGVVLDDTERFIAIPPTAVFASYETRLGLELIKRLRFSSALETLEHINLNLLEPEEVKLVNNLKLVASAYRYWDNFDHIRFSGEISKVNWDVRELAPFKIDSEAKTRVLNIGKSVAKKELIINDDLIIDIFNNAERRNLEGKYDDALARLYRAIEMLAQYKLSRQYGIKTGDVDLKKVPDKMRRELESQRDSSDRNKIKIGLKKSYGLLGALGDKLGEEYLGDKKLQSCLNERNYSILAHGNKTVRHELYRTLRDSVFDLLSMEIEELSNKANTLNFPWLMV